MGRRAEACEVLSGLESIARERFLRPYAMALTLLGLSEHERALEFLERGYEVRDVGLIFLPVDPKWDAFRPHARFRQLIQRCNFERADLPAGAVE